MLRIVVLALASLTAGCTVGWLALRSEGAAPPGWKCPAALKVSVTSAHTTNSLGPKGANPEKLRALENRYRALAESSLRRKQCVPIASHPGETLQIKIEEMQQLSALPQEYLTGLSLGLIPSWGTRPAEVRFSFAQGSRSASYVVDDKRINHLVLFPVFWLSFLLADNDAEFQNALNDFTTGL